MVAAGGGLSRWRRLLLATVVAFVAGGASAQHRENLYTLQLHGACEQQSQMDLRLFELRGYTAVWHAPYYESSVDGEQTYWMYYDINCDGGNDPTPRWIIDTHQPDPTRQSDLTNSGATDYVARLDSEDYSNPPLNARWRMKCGENGFVAIDLSFLIITSTSTTTTTATATSTTATSTTTSTSTSTTTTTETTTSTTQTTTVTTVTETTSTVTSTTSTFTETTTSVTQTTTSMTTSTRTETSTTSTTMTHTTSTNTISTTFLDTLVLRGVCEQMYWLDGLVFHRQGVTVAGAPWYKATWGPDVQYLYYDPDCGLGREPMWIIDPDEPDESRAEDLDNDGKCNYHARTYSESTDAPPNRSEWRMHCAAAGWQDLNVTLLPPTAEDPGRVPNPQPEAIKIHGSCSEKSWLDEQLFVMMGHSASGASVYHAVEIDQYIYYDPHCDGSNESVGRWIIDNGAPNMSAPSDLDGDGACNYHTRVDVMPEPEPAAEAEHGTHGEDPALMRPPAEATWRMYCNGTWQDVDLIIYEAQAPTTDHEGTISGSERGARWRWCVALASLVPLGASVLDL